MKNISIACLILITIFCGCKKETGYYDSMHFVRNGGGQIDFTLYPTVSSDTLEIMVSEYEYQDTAVMVIIARNVDNSSLFSTLHDAMNNKTKINGNFSQSTLPSGTWSYIYFISNDGEFEVTNTDLRDKLLEFEKIVEDEM